MPFERATERVQADGAKLAFDFDHAYWMTDLEPVDRTNGVARFDARSFGIAERPRSTVPEAGGPATPDQTGPYAMTGQAWRAGGTALPDRRNAFEATLSGAAAAAVDLERMRLDADRPLTGDVKTGSALRLTLTGAFPKRVVARVDGRRATVVRAGRRLAIAVPAGRHRVVVAPA
jgi:hypothetical protein